MVGVGIWRFWRSPAGGGTGRQTKAATRPATADDAQAADPADAADAKLSEYAEFVRSLHTPFAVDTEQGPLALRLTEVGKLQRQIIKGAPHESFAVYFEGPATPVLPDAIHHLRHERMGELEFFLSAYGKAERAAFYQALFDRAV
jgi:hypothetical protein